MRLRPNLVLIGCALAFVASVVVILFLNFDQHPETAHPSLALACVLWLSVFFAPPFFVASRANDQGALYGLVIGLVPLVMATLIGYSVPLPFALIFYAFAPLGGFLGQRLSRSRRAG